MDEIWFHLSNQFEALQIKSSLVAQQGQQWITAWLAQVHQFFYELYNKQNVQNVKDIIQHIFRWLETAWKQLKFQYYNAHFSIEGFYKQ